MKKLWIFILLGLLLISLVSAIQPTQQYNKIFLNPFYRVSTTANTNYQYNITIDTPDGISKVNSAIITFKIYMTPTVTFNLTVNGQSCNNPLYVVSTTFSGSGQGEVTFDCSNRITQKGNYTLILRPTQANTGAITGWLDLTYMNNPVGDLKLSGTEYSPGDPAAVFVQLKDSYGNAVQNGSCYLDIYTPTGANYNNTLQDAPMTQADGNDGLYYYLLTAPSTLGVYMLSAKCSYTYNYQWYYPPTELVYYPILNTTSGTYTGSSQALNALDLQFMQCDVASLGIGCLYNLTYNLSTYGPLTNVTTINGYFAGQYKGSSGVTWTVYMSYWNGTKFVVLPNTLTLIHQVVSPTGVDQFLTNSIPTTAILNNKSLILQFNITGGSGTGSSIWIDWTSLAILSQLGTVQDVKGNSEMHITNIPNTTVTLINNQTPFYVWNYTNRNLTYYPPVNASGLNVTATIDNDAIALAVWNATTRNLTYYQDVTNYTQIGLSVWTNTFRNLTYFDYVTEGQYVWNTTNRNLTFYPTTDFTNISAYVWNYTARYTHGVILN